MTKVEAERSRLSTVLQLQHLLHSLQQDHVKKDLLTGHNQAPHIPAQQLHSLCQLTTLLGVKRDNRLRRVSSAAHSSQSELYSIDSFF